MTAREIDEAQRIECLQEIARGVQAFVDDDRGIMGPTLAAVQRSLELYVKRWGRP